MAGTPKSETIARPDAAWTRGLAIAADSNHIVVRFGRTNTEVIAVFRGSPIYEDSVSGGSDAMDEAIARSVVRKHDVVFGEEMVTRVRAYVDVVNAAKEERTMEAPGRSRRTGRRVTVTLDANDLGIALAEPIDLITAVASIAARRLQAALEPEGAIRGVIVIGSGPPPKLLMRALHETTRLSVEFFEPTDTPQSS